MATMTAISSIRLLVVNLKPPESSLRLSPMINTAPYPPGPGLPILLPSVKIVITPSLISGTIAFRSCFALDDLHHNLPVPVFGPGIWSRYFRCLTIILQAICQSLILFTIPTLIYNHFTRQIIVLPKSFYHNNTIL